MRFPSFPWLALLSIAAGTSACSGSVNHAQSSGTGGEGTGATTTTTSSTTTSSTTTRSTTTSDTMYPAPHPAPPQVVNGNGTLLSSAKLVPVFFPNDAFQAQLTDFAARVGGTQYWATTTSEYGIGPATGESAVVLTEAAPATIDDPGIQTWLAGKLDGDDPAWPAPDQSTLYILHYPASTTITQSSQGQTITSCQDFGGYHSSTTLDAAHGSQEVAYAVIPRCSSFGKLTGVDAVTGAESHEIIEAVTDAHPMADAAYGQVDDAHLYWELALGGGEVGDLCAQFPGVFVKSPELGHVVQRTWSNASAKAGHDPCVPQPTGEVYFNTVPVLSDSIALAGLGTLRGVTIPVGSSKTIDLDLFSDGDTGGPWDVQVEDFLALTMGGTATMGFSLDNTRGQNGDKLHLTIDVLKKNQYGAGIFVIISSLGQQQTLWLGFVSNG
jgi:hypothetical protein